jgi:hypothetical protein
MTVNHLAFAEAIHHSNDGFTPRNVTLISRTNISANSIPIKPPPTITALLLGAHF